MGFNSNTKDYSNFIKMIDEMALERSGSAFDFQNKYIIIKESYTKDKIVGLWHKKSHSYDTQREYKHKQFCSLIRKLPKGISVKNEYVVFQDERTQKSQESHSVALVEKGYLCTISVSKDYSMKSFMNNYGSEGFRFRDYLLQNRKSIIEQICQEDRVNPPRWGNQFCSFTFYVSPSGITNHFDTECSALSVRDQFSQLGMMDLDNLAQCYGMALAIIQMNKSRWMDMDVQNISVKRGYNPFGNNYYNWIEVHGEKNDPKGKLIRW